MIDLRNPTRSDGSNLLTLINRYMDIAREHPDNLAARAKAEKYAKILAKTIVNPGGDDQDRGQNAFFYDAAEGLLTSVILLLAEYIPLDLSLIHISISATKTKPAPMSSFSATPVRENRI